jgi:four helix bundle protein
MTINSKENKYDLEERTTKFAESVIDFIKTIKVSPLNIRIIEQLVGSAGSIGANYCEATEAESKKDFIHKLGICKKEIKETSYWLRLLARVHNDKKDEIKVLWKEAHELLLIFSKIIQSSKSSKIDN